MSGSLISTGLLTNKGEKLLKIEKLLDMKIEDLSIQIIPLWLNTGITFFRNIGKALQQYIHPAIFSPTLSHIAIQLNLENKYIVILEYGQYYSIESEEIINTGFFSSSSDGSKSKKNPRTKSNNLLYWYINKDGARLTIIDSIDGFEFCNDLNNFSKEEISNIGLSIIAANYYGMSIEEFDEKKLKLSSISDFNTLNCDIKNKITLRELCNKFKNKNWEANKYNVIDHNCQDFAAEVIKILKAIRINDRDKVRWREKRMLPNCIISALWDNEELSVINTIGRIPIFGYIFDIFASKII